MPPPARLREALADLTAAGPDGPDLLEAALLFAAVNRPTLDPDPYRRHVDALVAEVAEYAGQDTTGANRAEALRQVVAGRYGYAGGDPEAADPEDCDIARAIDSRVGCSEVLCLIYLAVAGRLGWPVHGVDFPPRMMLRLEGEGERMLIDPVDRGRLVGAAHLRSLLKESDGMEAELAPEHYRDMAHLDILLRLQRAAKLRYLRHERLREALGAVETTLAMDPGTPGPWREAGLLNARLDNVAAAVAALEEYLRHDGADPARHRTTVLLQELRGRLG